MEKRICTKCNLEKDFDDFAWKSEHKNLKASECKTCHKETRHNYYIKNAKTEKERIYKRKKELAKWLQEFKKTLKCEICSENEPCCLEFHHTDPNMKEINIALCATYGWSVQRTKNEIEKCIVICSNCHKKLHAGISQW